MNDNPTPVPSGARIAAIDVVRGLAVLGILGMNIVEFGLPMRAYENPTVAGGSEGADRWVWLLQESLFDGRMRALFSLLFGAGLVLFSQRMTANGRGASAADLLLRRCLWLIPFGIVHRFLLQWTGDILYIYGLFGVLAVAFRGMRPRAQILIGLLVLLLFVPMELRKYANAAESRDQAAAAQMVRASEHPVSEELAAGERRWLRRLEPPAAGANDEELKAIRGSWTDVVRHRWDHNHSFQSSFVYYYFAFDVFGMMLIGMGLLQLGFFAGGMATAAYLGFLAAGGLATATSFFLASSWSGSGWSRGAIELECWRGMLYAFLRLCGALGWASVLILLVRAGKARLVTAPLAAVGRMAFSNYVLQTVLCTLFFFGWGLGYFGRLSRAQLMVVFGAVSLVQIVWSLLWLRLFRFGPLEWVWRCATYWRRQPFLRS